MKINYLNIKNVIFILLLVYLDRNLITAAIPFKCPINQLHFEKILGFRPDVTYLLQPLVTDKPGNAINLECWEKCHNDIECVAYVLFYRTFECYGFTANKQSLNHNYLPPNLDIIADPDAVYFNKICLSLTSSCNSRLWPIVRIPGSSLVIPDTKRIPYLVTRMMCAELCIAETEFQCLSAKFIVSHRNVLSRNTVDKLYGNDEIGQCILSADDKSTQPNSFRVATIDEEYIENQCIERAPTNVFCSFEQYTTSQFIYADLEQNGFTQKECQERCSLEKKFYCQGVTFVDSQLATKYSRCLFHSEDTLSMGPRAVKFSPHSLYLRRVKCLNVSVFCDDDFMAIEYKPSHQFRGQIFVNSNFKECSVQGQQNTKLKVPIGNEIQESRCGIVRAYEVNGPWNRTLISTLIVIQNNHHIQTQGDRLIKVGCILNNNTNVNGLPDSYAVGSSIEINKGFPNQGALVVNASTPLPQVTMKIIDLSDQQTTNDVQLGQNLEFILNVMPPNMGYDIQAKNLIAKSGNGNSVIHLLDERGCPFDSSVFPALTKFISRTTQSLRARFQAFKFVESSGVKFEVVIRYCHIECPPIDCRSGRIRSKRNEPNPNATLSKELDESPENIYQSVFSSFKNDVEATANITETTRRNFTRNERVLREPTEVPLNIEINVHSPKAGETESLIYGENSSILIAGIDIDRDGNMLCMSPGMIIIVLLFWLLIQVVLLTGCCVLIKKYRKLAEMEEDRQSLHRIQQSLVDTDSLNRRVRWADQGSFCNTSSQVMFVT